MLARRCAWRYRRRVIPDPVQIVAPGMVAPVLLAATRLVEAVADRLPVAAAPGHAASVSHLARGAHAAGGGAGDPHPGSVPDPGSDGAGPHPAAHAARWGANVCRCGHDKAAHAHYRRGSDCAMCGPARCPRFRTQPRGAWLQPIAGRLRRRPAAR